MPIIPSSLGVVIGKSLEPITPNVETTGKYALI